MMRIMVKVVGVALLAALLFAATGCDQIIGGAVENAAEKATGVSVDKSSNSVTVKGEKGEVTVGSAELPEGFPEEVPVYEGEIKTSIKTPEGFSVSIETDDSSADVFEWYKTELENGGWTIKNEIKVERGANLTAENADWSFNMTAATDKDTGKTTLVISLQSKSK